MAKKSDGFASVMKGLAGQYDTAIKNAGQGRGGLAVGSYQLEVTDHTMKPISKGKNKGQLGVVVKFAVAEGKKQGKKHSKFYNLQMVKKDCPDAGAPIGLSMYLEDMETMGVKIKKSELKTLAKNGQEVIGAIVEAEVVQNGDYRNTYINDLVQESTEEEEDEEEVDDEEIEEEEEEVEDEDEDEEADDDDVDLEDDEEEEEAEEPDPPKRKRGRPKGSNNKPKKGKKKKSADDDEDLETKFD